METGMRTCLLLLLGSVLLAQSAERFPLEGLRILGNERTPTERIVAASGLKAGSRVNKSDFDAARDRLMATGAFENVGYEYKPSTGNTGYDATFQVVEIEQLFPYRFEELPVSDQALRAALRKQEPIFDDRIPNTPTV